MTQQIEIPQGYHYVTDYNTLHMILNLGYQGTRDFNPQMGQQVQRNPNSYADELLLKVTEMMKNQFGLKPKGLIFSYKRPYLVQIIGFQSLSSSLAKTVQAR